MRHEHPLISTGKKRQPPRYRFSTTNYEHFQVIYVSTGLLYFTKATGKTVLGPGSVALLREGSGFTLWTESCGYGGVYCNVIGDPHPDLRGASFAFKATVEHRMIAGFLEREIAAPGRNSQALLLNLGWTLAWLAIRASQVRNLHRDHSDYVPQLAESVRQALAATVYTGKSAREVLSALPLSYRQLARHFKTILHASPKQYQLQIRIREAQRLLAFTRRSVTDIAYEMGYSSSQHFASQFVQCMRQTPTAFRQRKAQHAFKPDGDCPI